MKMRKTAIVILLILCMPFAAAAISNFTVPSVVQLNKNLTIFGDYSGGGNVLCAFFIFDTVDGNRVIIRLSDEHTFFDGSFYTEHQITEPVFRRGFDYNAVTKCGADEASQLFYVDQKEDMAFGVSPEMMRMDWQWWLNPENSLTVTAVGLCILIFAFLAYGMWADIQRVSSGR